MRRVFWMAVVGSVWLMAGPAAAQDAGCGCAARNPYSAPACGAPCYGMGGGCCESSSPCCQNVWDGYQEEQDRMYAFWARVEGHCKAKVAEGRCARGCGRPYCTSCNPCSAPTCEAGCEAGGAKMSANPAPMTPAVGRTMGFRAPIRPKF